MSAVETSAWQSAVLALLGQAHTMQASGLADSVNVVTTDLTTEITLYLADCEQRALRPVPAAHLGETHPLQVDATLAGRAFMTMRTLMAPGDPVRLWVPIVNGTEREGVMMVLLPPACQATPDVVSGCVLFAGVVGHLITTKSLNGDTFHLTRRSQPMEISAELLLPLLPPLTFSTDTMVIAALLEPCYTMGGDAFDYAVDNDRAFIGIFDGMGHGLRAAVTTSVALAAIRRARRCAHDLPAMAAAADAALNEQFGDRCLVTAVLIDLDLRTGILRYVNAGHMPPVMFRDGKTVASLSAGRRLPLGFGGQRLRAGRHVLQPGDRMLLFSDGVVEARDSTDAMFGVERLVDLAGRSAASGLPPAETARRLIHAILAHQRGVLQDDASLVLIDWSPAAAARSYPPG